MIVYQVGGGGYDGYYRGNTYATRQLAEAEAAYLNKRQQANDVFNLVYYGIEDYLSEVFPSPKSYKWGGKNSFEEEFNLHYAYRKRDSFVMSWIFNYSAIDIPGYYVGVSEIEVLEELPAKFNG
jgi:hypothetical protein